MRSTPTLFRKREIKQPFPVAGTGCCRSKSWLSFPCTLLSRIYFSWVTDFLLKGYKNTITSKDLYETNQEDTSKYCANQLKEALQRQHESKKRPNLCRAYLSAFRASYFPAGLILRPIWLCFCIIQIFSLRELIAYVGRAPTNTEDQNNAAIWSIVGFCLGAMLQPLLICHLFIWSLRTGLRARAATTTLIWERLSTMRASELHSERGADILNLAEVDTVRIVEGFRYGHFMWCGILVEFPIVTAMVYLEAGPSAILGILVLCLAIPIQAYFAKRIGHIQGKVAKKTDKRSRLMQEILSGIEMVKVNAWENNFSQSVNVARNEEVNLLKTSEIFKALNASVFQAAPLLAAACVFAVKSLANGQILESSSTFATLAWFNLIFRTLIMVPRGVSHFVEARVSANRIQSFLFSKKSSIIEPIQMTTTETLPINESTVVNVKNCSWGWNENDICLNNVTFQLKENECLGVIGEIGSGKTSLLCALQNDLMLYNRAENVSKKKSTATKDLPSIFGIRKDIRMIYIPQTPFIVSCSLHENITFGLEFNLQKFNTIIQACALKKDIETFPDGINTQIGERGVTLSGGQSQRVALARACYAAKDGDLILCDDVLSALDTTVAADIYQNVLSSDTGILKKCTKIIVTHALWSITDADYVLELNEHGQGTARRQAKTDVNVGTSDAGDSIPAAVNGEKVIAEEAIPEALDVSDINFHEVKQTNQSIATASTTSETAVYQLVKKEHSEEGRVRLKTWLTYIDSGMGRCPWFSILLLFIITQILRVGTDWWIANWTEDKFFENVKMISTNVTSNQVTTIYNYDENVKYAIGYFSIVIIYCIFVFARTLLFTFAMLKSSQNLHNSMFTSVLSATMSWFWATPTGRILNRFTRDVDCVDRLMVKSAQDWWNFMFIALGAIITMMSVIPWLLLVVIPLILLFLVTTRFFVRTSRQLKRISGTTRSPIYVRLGEYLNGLKVIHSLSQGKKLLQPFLDCIDLNVSSEFMFEVTSRWLGARLDTLSALNNGVLAFVSFYFAEHLDAGLVGVALVQSLQLSGVLQYSIRQAAEVESLMVSVERVSAYSKIPMENLNDCNTDATTTAATPTIPADWPSKGNIQVVNLCLRYRPNLPLALQNINFNVSSGQVLGICGRSGSGKSSLMSSFFRLIQPELNSIIEIDNVNILKLPLQILRRRLTVITQMPVLLGGTIRSNIDPFNEHDDEEMMECLQRCQLIKCIVKGNAHEEEKKESEEKKKEGKMITNVNVLSVQVHEGGTNFSAGERQLICVARALLASPKLLLLDEASSNIDPETDAIFQKMIRSEFSACTKLIVAHRINTIIDADTILVLDKGKVVEFDSPRNLLLDNKSHFSKLVDSTGMESAKELRKSVL
jgi:ATP-binding cassette subfamily C (CFTR/MRP) protein 4